MQRIAHKPKSGLKEQITESLPGAVTKVSTKLSFEVKPLQQWVCIQFAPPIGVQKNPAGCHFKVEECTGRSADSKVSG